MGLLRLARLTLVGVLPLCRFLFWHTAWHLSLPSCALVIIMYLYALQTWDWNANWWNWEAGIV